MSAADDDLLREVLRRRGAAFVAAALARKLEEAEDEVVERGEDAAAEVLGSLAHDARMLADELRRLERKEARREERAGGAPP